MVLDYKIRGRKVTWFDPARQELFDESRKYAERYFVRKDLPLDNYELFEKTANRYLKKKAREKNESLIRVIKKIKFAEGQLAAINKCREEFGEALYASIRKKILISLHIFQSNFRILDTEYKTICLHLMEEDVEKRAREAERFAKGNAEAIGGSPEFQIMVW